MLVLSRKKNEMVMVGDDIKIVVVEIRGDKVRLGIEAPQDVPVHRIEVYDAIQRKKKADPDATNQINKHDTDQAPLSRFRTSKVGKD